MNSTQWTVLWLFSGIGFAKLSIEILRQRFKIVKDRLNGVPDLLLWAVALLDAPIGIPLFFFLIGHNLVCDLFYGKGKWESQIDEFLTGNDDPYDF